MAIFDGENLIMTIEPPVGGVLNVDVQEDWYKAWKVWQNEKRGNLGYPPLFLDNFGGNLLKFGTKAGAYFILQNKEGWRIKASEESQTIYLTGNLVVQDSTLPITIPTIGGFTVTILGLQPITQNVEVIQISLAELREIALNERAVDPVTGIETIYKLDDVTPKFQADVYEDAAQTTKYNSNSTKIERRKRMQ